MTKKRAAIAKLKATAAKPVTIERKGTAADGTEYEVSVTIGGVHINGADVPNDVAANTVADMIEGAIKRV